MFWHFYRLLQRMLNSENFLYIIFWYETLNYLNLHAIWRPYVYNSFPLYHIVFSTPNLPFLILSSFSCTTAHNRYLDVSTTEEKETQQLFVIKPIQTRCLYPSYLVKNHAPKDVSSGNIAVSSSPKGSAWLTFSATPRKHATRSFGSAAKLDNVLLGTA